MQTVIITAFEPFDNHTMNPTEKLIQDIPKFLYNAKVIKVTLPVVYNHAFDTLLPYIEKHQPDVILMLGLAAGRTHVNLERIAININDANVKDNLGNIMHNTIIKEDGEDGLFTTFPLEAILARAHKKALPLSISNTAGAYVCNNLMYQTLYYLKKHHIKTLAGFMHVPYLPEQVTLKPGTPSLPKQLMFESIMTTLDTMINPVEI